MKHFINRPGDLVQESIEGLVAASGGSLRRLAGFPDIKVVVRAHIDPAKVALISGGGSGHEPAHAGFIGEGMLTAAVCGEIFASPSVEAVLAAILAVTGEAGCILIVKNYTGDRLNFGLAAEQARARGIQVETVIVADDIALPEVTQPRGIAGTLFVHKVAGACAEAGGSLSQVSALARRVASRVISLGMSLSSCHPPGAGEERLGTRQAELGLGIHGEPGVETIPLESADKLVERMLSRLPAGLGESALLINNLGGVPPLEMGLLTHCLLRSRLRGCVKLVVGPSPLMTSYDMNGFSVSLLALDEEIQQALEAPTGVTAWPPARALVDAPPLSVPGGLRPSFPPSENPFVRERLTTICAALIDSESLLNDLDRKVGDGDTGTTLATMARSVNLDDLPLNSPAQLLQALASRMPGGSSGVLLSIFLAAASQHVQEGWAGALQAGLQRMCEIGGARLGDRTAIDALAPALNALPNGLPAAAAAASAGAQATGAMPQAGAGRSAYVPADNLQGVPDPGAQAVALVFEALASGG